MSSGPPLKRLKQTALSFTGPQNEAASTSADNKSEEQTLPVGSGSSGDIVPNEAPKITPIGTEPFHPTASFDFPKTKNRACQAKWFTEWKWLHYNKDNDTVRCFTCVSAIEKKLMLLKDKKSEMAFLEKGFCCWRNGTTHFRTHERSVFHSIASEKLLASTRKGIPAMMSDRIGHEQKLHREGLNKIFSAIFYLGQQGMALRGKENNDGPFYNLVMEMVRENQELQTWLKKRDSYMSNTIQNEVIEMIAHQIQREIIQDASASAFVGITADGTTDVSGKEQFALCLQYLNKDLVTTVSFLGFYNPPDTKGETLAATVWDMLVRLGVPTEKLAGCSFDTAANMSGLRKGAQAYLKMKVPHCIYVPCCNHSLDLCLQELTRVVTTISDTLEFVKNCSNVIRESANRRQMYVSMFGEEKVVHQLMSLCPTRWCVRGAAIKRVLQNYQEVRKTLVQLSNERSVRTSSLAVIKGLAKQSGKIKTFISLSICAEIFNHCDIVARLLQRSDITPSESLSAVASLKRTLQGIRENLPNLVTEASVQATSLELQLPAEKRQTKTPARLRHDAIPEPRPDENFDFHHSLVTSFRCGVDTMLQELEERFNSSGMKLAVRRENVLLKAAVDDSFQPDMYSLDLPPSVDVQKLRLQLRQLKALVGAENASVFSVAQMASLFQTKDKVIHILFSEIIKLLSLCLCQPCSNASSERAFACLRRLKTWCRSTMEQKRLTHLALMATNRTVLMGLNRVALMKEFINRTPERRSVFGSTF